MVLLHLNTDGGSRGNPGPAAIGAILKSDSGEILERKSSLIGEATNNEAEYRALIEGLRLARQYQPEKLICRLDSSLVVNQVTGRFKINEAHLRKLVAEVQEEVLELKGTEVTFQYVPREENREADRLLNQTLNAAR